MWVGILLHHLILHQLHKPAELYFLLGEGIVTITAFQAGGTD